MRHDWLAMASLCVLCVCTPAEVMAVDQGSIAFFVSNNTGDIPPEEAYQRLRGPEQKDLRDQITHLAQRHHLEQGTLTDSLGVGSVTGKQTRTADNTAVLNTSPYEHFNSWRIFPLARHFAKQLQQHTIVVFIPDEKAAIGDITVHFGEHPVTIEELAGMLTARLPADYSQSYFLHLTNTCHDYLNTKVSAVEWPGSKLSVEVLRNVFPTAEINVHYGNAWLVYTNGKKVQL